MGADEVKLVRESIAAFQRGDFEGWIGFFDPEAVFEPLRAAMLGAYRGHAGIREWLADTEESFEKFELTVDEVRDVGDGRVLSLGTLHLLGRGSGIETDVPIAALITIRDGMFTAFKDYGDHRKALEATRTG